jgi:hypothetical protein
LKCPAVVAQLAVQIAKAIRTGDADGARGPQEEKPAMAAKLTQTTRPEENLRSTPEKKKRLFF